MRMRSPYPPFRILLKLLSVSMLALRGCGDDSTKPESDVSRIAGRVEGDGSGKTVGARLSILTVRYRVEIEAGTFDFDDSPVYSILSRNELLQPAHRIS
jgi:hypothetical protein